ncbi:MAG: alpha-L-fucosidase [Kiritimatiellales bacterium]
MTDRIALSKSTNGSFLPSWNSIRKVPIPPWYQDAKFGIMIHWGPYSVPGYSSFEMKYAEWYARNMYANPSVREHHINTYGKNFGYADFVPMFTALEWDPVDWADLFRKSGARYVIPVAEHHDGFAMWDSELTEWNAVKMGPKRDVIGELGKAVRERGMKYAPSYHRERHYKYFRAGCGPHPAGMFPSIEGELAKHPKRIDLYGPFDLSSEFIAGYLARWDEIDRKYQPDFMWLDHCPSLHEDYPESEAYRQAFLRMITDYLNRAAKTGREVYFNNKGRGGSVRLMSNFPEDVGIRGEDNLLRETIGPKWENPATLGHSYGYSEMEDRSDAYRSSVSLIHELIDVVSKNGNLLLNIGPRADGTIPENQRRRLLAIGDWLEVNGESIYDTVPWIRPAEGDHLRFTVRNQVLYVHALEWPKGEVTVKSLAGFTKDDIRSVRLLGHGDVSWNITPDGLIVDVPSEIANSPALVFRMNFQDPSAVKPKRASVCKGTADAATWRSEV